VGPVTALAGVCLQDVERGAHEGGKRPLASRLRPVSSKATQPPTYLPLHRVHLVRERPVRMSRRKVLLHNVIVEFSPDTPRYLYLSNIRGVPVHLTKGYVVGTATAYNGPLHVVADEGEPGAVLTIGMDTPSKSEEEAETSRRAEEGIDEGQRPPHPPDTA